MLIVWGTRRVERQVGEVTENCPICDGPRAFRRTVIERVRHLYFIPMSRTAVGETIRCTDCGAILDPDLVRLQAPDSDPTSPVVADTSPAAERAERLLRPFEALESMIVYRLAEGMHFDRHSSIGCLGAIATLVGIFTLAGSLPKKYDVVISWSFLLVLALTLYTFVQFFLNPRRSARRKVIPLLVRALAPLAPLHEELTACIDHCRESGMKIGRLVDVEGLWSALQARGGSHPVSMSPGEPRRPR